MIVTYWGPMQDGRPWPLRFLWRWSAARRMLADDFDKRAAAYAQFSTIFDAVLMGRM